MLITYLLTYQKARRLGCIGCGEVDPFVEDENNKIEEDAQHKNELRDELTKDVQGISEVSANVIITILKILVLLSIEPGLTYKYLIFMRKKKDFSYLSVVIVIVLTISNFALVRV